MASVGRLSLTESRHGHVIEELGADVGVGGTCWAAIDGVAAPHNNDRPPPDDIAKFINTRLNEMLTKWPLSFPYFSRFCKVKEPWLIFCGLDLTR